MKMILIIVSLFLLFLGCSSTTNVRQGLPSHPSKIQYQKQVFVPPSLIKFEYKLDNGITVFIKEDNKLPIFDINIYMDKVGDLYSPDKKGLISTVAGYLIANGGTEKLSADSVSSIRDFNAISISSFSKSSIIKISNSSLKDNYELTLELLSELFFTPGFDSSKLELYKTKLINNIQHRFDSPRAVTKSSEDYLLYGEGVLSSLINIEDVKALSRTDLLKYYKASINPLNMIITVSGRINKKDILEKLNKEFGKIKALPITNVIDNEFDFNPIKEDLLFVEKETDQVTVKMLLPLFKRPSPDYYPLILANHILGGASFTSRISRRVREEEGLAYGAGSQISTGYEYPGYLYVYIQTKSSTAAYATDLAYQEIEGFVKDGFTKAELDNAKKSIISSFPASFKTSERTLRAFAENRLNGRTDKHFEIFTEKLNKISIEEVRAVANKYLKRKNFKICMIGSYDASANGDGVHSVKLSDFGTMLKITEDKLEEILSK